MVEVNLSDGFVIPGSPARRTTAIIAAAITTVEARRSFLWPEKSNAPPVGPARRHVKQARLIGNNQIILHAAESGKRHTGSDVPTLPRWGMGHHESKLKLSRLPLQLRRSTARASLAVGAGGCRMYHSAVPTRLASTATGIMNIQYLVASTATRTPLARRAQISQKSPLGSMECHIRVMNIVAIRQPIVQVIQAIKYLPSLSATGWPDNSLLTLRTHNYRHIFSR